jgi:hypothetical protein
LTIYEGHEAKKGLLRTLAASGPELPLSADRTVEDDFGWLVVGGRNSALAGEELWA